MQSNERYAFSLESTNADIEALEILRFTATEEMSRLYSVTIDAVAKHHAKPATDLLGEPATVVVRSESGEIVRRFAGICANVDEEFHLDDPDRAVYRLRVVPRAHFFTLVRTQEISLDRSVPEILKHKLELVGLEHEAASHMSLTGEYAKREFVVQFDETDIDFIGRLTEHLGICYFFEQLEDGDRIVFTDHNDRFPVTPHLDGPVPLVARADDRGIHGFRLKTECVPHDYLVMDYNYRTPNTDLTGNGECAQGYLGGIVEYGGHFKTPVEGAALARARAEEAEGRRVVYEGNSGLVPLSVGHRIKLDGHPRLDGLDIVVTQIDHTAEPGPNGGHVYRNRFRAFPLGTGTTYRPPRRTPKPKISGLLTGIVEQRAFGVVERYARIDEQGRYVIRFAYDPTPPTKIKASHPVRKAEPTVGPDYGMHFPLRPGVEVVMAFVNGDPDRPVILGGLHNTTVPAHVRDANAQINGIKTASGIKMHFKDD